MLDFSKIKTYPIRKRNNLVTLKDFADINQEIDLLENKDLEILADKITDAHEKNKQVILMMGAHVIKVGMSPYIIDLMKKGLITHVAMNGAGPIHDFEIALIGETSEDVGNYLEDGSFGMIEETGKFLNEAAKEGAEENIGYGKAIGKKIADMNLEFKEYNILYNAYKLNIPVTVHIAIGTDIIHQHPDCDGASLGKASFDDFKIFTESVSKLSDGVIMNLGCAVIMPETFLKALTISRNLGFNVENFTAANIDMIDHYRPRRNVVERPTQNNGLGLIIIERHEKTVPTLYKNLQRRLKWS